MSQEIDILAHLKNRGSITQMVALELFGCMRLAARIERLRLQGWKIDTQMVPTIGKNGEKKQFARYILKSKRRGKVCMS